VAYFNYLGSAPHSFVGPLLLMHFIAGLERFRSSAHFIYAWISEDRREEKWGRKGTRAGKWALSISSRSPEFLLSPSGNSGAPWFKSTIKPQPLNIYEPGFHNMSARARRQAATLCGCPAITDTHVRSFRSCAAVVRAGISIFVASSPEIFSFPLFFFSIF